MMGAYATVAEMRLSGAPVSGAPGFSSDARLADALETASRTIDRLTGFFFELRAAQTYRLDGDGTPVLELPAPCIALTSLTVDGQAVDVVNGVVNYNRSPESMADDYWYPRLEWKSGPLRLQRAFLHQRGRPSFWKGELNVQVIGSFGFVVYSAAASGYIAPPEIKRATMMLAEMYTKDLASLNAAQDRLGRFLQSESMGNYSYSFGSGGASSGNKSMTGDSDVDAILARYTRAQMSAPGWG